jgi:hypothetical protein
LREKEESEPTGNQYDRDANTHVRADGRFIFAGDSSPVHQIEINVIESKIKRVRQGGTGVRFEKVVFAHCQFGCKRRNWMSASLADSATRAAW